MTAPGPIVTATRPTRAAGFIERHGLWDEAQTEAAAEVEALVSQRGLRRVRVGWGDQHGIVRGKTLTIPEFRRSLREGKDFQLVTAIFDTTNHPIVPPFAAGNFDGAPELTGLPDGVLVPDPTTFQRAAVGSGHRLGAVPTPTSPTDARCRSRPGRLPPPDRTALRRSVSSSSPGSRSSST